MSQEIINYPFDSELDEDFDQPEKFAQTPGDVFENQEHSGDAGISYVNGYDLPDEDDEDDEEDDLILGDEDDLDADDLAEEDIDIEVDDDIDEVSDGDLVLDADDEGDDEDDDL